MKQKWSSIFLLNLVTLCCTAQTAGYKYYCLLDSVTTADFYSIALSPEIKAHVKTDYNDIRIVNKQDRWVPHVFHAAINSTFNEIKISNLQFSITENNKINTVVTIETTQNIITTIGLTIKNTAAKRFCTLSGSDDKKEWFVINDSILLAPVADGQLTTNNLQISFTPSNYKYIKVTIRNNNKDPFNIVNVLLYTPAVSTVENKLSDNPAPIFIQKDSGKISYLKVDEQQAFHFNNIRLKVSGPKYFYRKVELYVPDASVHSFSNPGKLLQSFIISNNSTLQFNLPLSNARTFYLLINNEDNLPLTVNEINTASDAAYITAYLEKGEFYKLIIDNSTAEKPVYDLTNFNKTIPDNIPFLSIGKIQKAGDKIVSLPAKNMQWIVWDALIAVLIILLFVTKKMIQEVDKTKQHDSL